MISIKTLFFGLLDWLFTSPHYNQLKVVSQAASEIQLYLEKSSNRTITTHSPCSQTLLLLSAHTDNHQSEILLCLLNLWSWLLSVALGQYPKRKKGSYLINWLIRIAGIFIYYTDLCPWESLWSGLLKPCPVIAGVFLWYLHMFCNHSIATYPWASKVSSK